MASTSRLYILLIGIHFLSLSPIVHSEEHSLENSHSEEHSRENSHSEEHDRENNHSPTKEYSSYRPNPVCRPSEFMRYPKTEQDVVDIVIGAIRNGLTVKPFGPRHSQTDIICTEGIPVDNRGLQFFQINPDNTATFGAGVSVRSATEYLRLRGLALQSTPAFGNITIGGAIGTGAHGSSIKYDASISSQVVGVRIVDGKGKLRDVTDAEDLQAFKLNLGLLGIVVKATLKTIPLYKTRAHNFIVPDEILTNGTVIQMARETDQMTLYWFPAVNEVVVALWTRVDVSTPGEAFTYDHVPSTYEATAGAAVAFSDATFNLTSSTCPLANSVGYTILHTIEYLLRTALLEAVPGWVPIYTEDGYATVNPAVGYYDLMIAPTCNEKPEGLYNSACLWCHGPDNNMTILDHEFGVDLVRLPELIKDVKKIINKTPAAFPIQGVVMRFSDKTDILMSTAYGIQTVHFEFYLWNRKDRYTDPSGSLAGYQTIIQLLVDKYDGRSHWAKSGLVFHNRKHLDRRFRRFPNARQQFVDAMNKYDPHGVFLNSFGHRMKKTGTKVDIDPKLKHCALLDNCICSKNNDCGKNQICTTISGYEYPVCKTKNEGPIPLPFDKSIFPGSGDILGFLTGKALTLSTTLLSNCTVDAMNDVLGDTTGDPLGTFLRSLGSAFT